jgi:hypothetical protein
LYDWCRKESRRQRIHKVSPKIFGSRKQQLNALAFNIQKERTGICISKFFIFRRKELVQ